MKNRFGMIALLCLLVGFPLFSQTAPQNAAPPEQDPALLIGTTLSDLVTRFGVPNSVYPVRGMAYWQDDVVFVYDSGEFFIYGNRVWQLKLQTVYGIKAGDPKNAVNLAMGEGKSFDDYTLFQLPSKVWPLTLRVNWDASGRASGIFIYRSDF
jgi:hypothetical protein